MTTKAALAELFHDAKSGPCSDCGQRYPIHVMQLDHRPGSGKLFHLSDPFWGHASPGLAKAIAALGSVEAAFGNDHVNWPHRDHQNWPHPRPI